MAPNDLDAVVGQALGTRQPPRSTTLYDLLPQAVRDQHPLDSIDAPVAKFLSMPVPASAGPRLSRLAASFVPALPAMSQMRAMTSAAAPATATRAGVPQFDQPVGPSPNPPLSRGRGGGASWAPEAMTPTQRGMDELAWKISPQNPAYARAAAQFLLGVAPNLSGLRPPPGPVMIPGVAGLPGGMVNVPETQPWSKQDILPPPRTTGERVARTAGDIAGFVARTAPLEMAGVPPPIAAGLGAATDAETGKETLISGVTTGATAGIIGPAGKAIAGEAAGPIARLAGETPAAVGFGAIQPTLAAHMHRLTGEKDYPMPTPQEWAKGAGLQLALAIAHQGPAAVAEWRQRLGAAANEKVLRHAQEVAKAFAEPQQAIYRGGKPQPELTKTLNKTLGGKIVWMPTEGGDRAAARVAGVTSWQDPAAVSPHNPQGYRITVLVTPHEGGVPVPVTYNGLEALRDLARPRVAEQTAVQPPTLQEAAPALPELHRRMAEEPVRQRVNEQRISEIDQSLKGLERSRPPANDKGYRRWAQRVAKLTAEREALAAERPTAPSPAPGAVVPRETIEPPPGLAGPEGGRAVPAPDVRQMSEAQLRALGTAEARSELGRRGAKQEPGLLGLGVRPKGARNLPEPPPTPPKEYGGPPMERTGFGLAGLGLGRRGEPPAEPPKAVEPPKPVEPPPPPPKEPEKKSLGITVGGEPLETPPRLEHVLKMTDAELEHALKASRNEYLRAVGDKSRSYTPAKIAEAEERQTAWAEAYNFAKREQSRRKEPPQKPSAGVPEALQAPTLRRVLPTMTHLEAAEYIAKHTTSESQREIMNKVVDRLREKRASGGKPGTFNYRPKDTHGSNGNYRLLSEKIGMNPSADYITAFHELVHAATVDLVRPRWDFVTRRLSKMSPERQREMQHARGDLSRLLTVVKRAARGQDFYKRYTAKNTMELLAMGLSDRGIQRWLDTVPYEGSTVWSKFVDVIRRALGLEPSKQTALSELLRISDKLLTDEPAKPTVDETLGVKPRETTETPAAGEPEVRESRAPFGAVTPKRQRLRKAVRGIERLLGQRPTPEPKMTEAERKAVPGMPVPQPPKGAQPSSVEKAVAVARLGLRQTIEMFNPAHLVKGERLNQLMAMKGEIDKKMFQLHRAQRFIKKELGKLSREQRMQFIDNAQHGRPQANADLQAIDDYFDDLYNAGFAILKRRRPGLAYIENYLPQMWTKPDEAQRIFTTTARRPLEGTKSFFRKRIIPDIVTGLARGLELVSDNPADWAEAYMHNVWKFDAFQHWVAGEDAIYKKMGQVRGFPVGSRAGKGSVPADFQAFDQRWAKIFFPPVDVPEYHDKAQMEGLMSAIQRLGVRHTRRLRLPGGALGMAIRGRKSIKTAFATDPSVLAHELGHAIDDKYHLQSRFLGRDPRIDSELQALAAQRHATVAPTTEYANYVQEPWEKMAVMLQAYIHAPELFRTTAPHVYEKFINFFKDRADLKPILDIKPGLETMSMEQQVAGRTIGAEYWGQRDLVRLIDNWMSADDIRSTMFGRSALETRNFLNGIQLGLSGFHANNIAYISAIHDLSIGLSKAMAGHPISAAPHLLRGSASLAGHAATGLPVLPLSAARYLARGRKFFDKVNDPDMRALADEYFSGGAKILRPEMAMSQSARLVRYWGKGKKLMALRHLLPAAIEAPTHAIMSAVERMQVGAFADLSSWEMQRNAKRLASGEVTRAEIMRKSVRDVQDRMGMLNYDNLFWNSNLKTAMMVLIRAPGWTLGTGRSHLMPAFTDLPRMAAAPFRGEVPNFTPRMAYALAFVAAHLGVGGAYHFLHTGRRPETLEDYLHPMNSNGDRVTFPTDLRTLESWIKAFYTEYNDPSIDSAHNLLKTAFTGPVPRALDELITNQTFRGPIRNPDDPAYQQAGDIIKWMFGTLQPITITQAEEEEADLATRAERFFGVTKKFDTGVGKVSRHPHPPRLHRQRAS